MPLLHHESSIRARQDTSSLSLKVCHSLLIGEEHHAQSSQHHCSQSSYRLKKPLPPSVDVFSHSDLSIVVDVIMNGHRLISESVRLSIMATHLVQMFRNNVAILRINNVSDAYIDESDGQVKVTVTPQRSVPPENPRSQIALASIHLTYRCKTAEDNLHHSLDSDFDLQLLNQAIDRFLTYHISKRYPLIFGRLGEKFDQDNTYFRSIAFSLFSMSRRSPNIDFRRAVRRCLKTLRRRINTLRLDSVNVLEECFGPLSDADISSRGLDPRADEDVVSAAMHRLLRIAFGPTLIRCTHVTEDTIAVQCQSSDTRSSPCLSVVDEDDYGSYTVLEDDDLLYSSELQDTPMAFTETDWRFLSNPPLLTKSTTRSPYGAQESRKDIEEISIFLRGSSAYAGAGVAEVSYSKLNDSGNSPHAITSRPSIGKDMHAYSDLYDSDSDCHSLSLSCTEENSSSTLYAEADSDSTNTNGSNTRHNLVIHEILASMDQSGHNETTLDCIESSDQSLAQTLSSITGTAFEPAPLCFLDTDRDVASDCDASSLLERSLEDEDLLSSVPAFAIDQTRNASPASLSRLSLLSDFIPMGDFRAFADDEDRDDSDVSLDYADEPGGNCAGYRANSEEDSFPTSQDSHKPPLLSDEAHCCTFLEKSAKSKSDDQIACLEGREPASAELCGVYNFAVHMGSEGSDLGIDSDDSFDEFAIIPTLQCSSPGRIGWVQSDMIIDSDEEDGECRWNLLG